MTSTYSTDLRLELMGTGDQSGTWGDTTNTNLGTLLEQAIAGVLSVAQGDTANLTLTTVNGGSDQARNAVVNITGALTANRNVVVQTAQKLYLIKNSTTGGFSIVAKTAAGSGVTIPPSSSQWVYSDGTNVIAGLIGNMPFNNLLEGYTTTATAAGTTTLTVTSTHTQYFTGATTQTVALPVTSTLVLGQEFEIVNLSSGAVTVNSSGGNLVATVAASSSVRVQCILTSGTSAASWNALVVNLSAYLPLAGGTMTGTLVNTGSTAGYTPFQGISTEAGAAAGPIIDLFRDSASPAASDVLPEVDYNGRDSAGNKQRYAYTRTLIVDATSTSEDAVYAIGTVVAGTEADRVLVGAGLYTAGATGGDKGVNTVNATTYYTDGVNTTITPWVAYTPVFTGFGTATSINFRSRKVGNTLEVMGTFTPGTTTATEARITLGFNGTSANVSVDSTLGVRTAVGAIAFNTAFSGSGSVLIEASQTFMCFGIESGSPALSSYAKALGSSFVSSVTLSFTALVPLS